jgi:hypothetical protein
MEIGEALYRKRTTGWLGDHYGFKEKEHYAKDKSKG